MLLLPLLLLLAATPSTASLSPCALTAEDWNTIKFAYLERNHYEPLRNSKCVASQPNSLQARYGNCTKPLGEVLLTTGLEQDCMQHFTSTLYNGLGANVPVLAYTLCQNKTFSAVIKSNICNALTVVGCPTPRDHMRFSVIAGCYGAVLKDMTPEQQLEYYSTGADTQCMVDKNVCVDFVTMNWNTCPLNITDVFEFIDPTKQAYTCDTIFTSAPDRCIERFNDIFVRYCPLPSELEKAVPIIVTCTLVAAAIIFAIVFALVRHRRKTHLHHITRREVMNHAVTNFQSFDQPLKGVHPELQTVLAESKFKNVVFDKTTQTWGVLGETKKYATEKDAAKKAYLNMAAIAAAQKNKQSAVVDTESTKAFLEIIKPTTTSKQQNEEYVVNATPLSSAQTYELRLEQLIAFYQYWEPEKPDVENHANNLLKKHEFEHVVRALKSKYGVCPPMWESFGEV